MKLPNNYGSISRLGGNRRRPFMIRKGTKIIGYHATKADALQALADYNNTPPRPVITVRSVYNAWFDSHRHNVSQSAVASYINAVKHIEPILDMPIDCVKFNHLQSIISLAALYTDISTSNILVTAMGNVTVVEEPAPVPILKFPHMRLW